MTKQKLKFGLRNSKGGRPGRLALAPSHFTSLVHYVRVVMMERRGEERKANMKSLAKDGDFEQTGPGGKSVGVFNFSV